jgi:hypothetical protein
LAERDDGCTGSIDDGGSWQECRQRRDLLVRLRINALT